MSEEFLVPASESVSEFEVRKSRFIGTVRPVGTPEEAREAVRRERGLHPDARHVVFAFLVGDPKSETAGASDDGEPKGTAGRPVLDVLRGSGIRNTVVTVTRYFGGVKLGTGGIVRAYAECAREALRRVKTVRFVPRRCFSAVVPYESYETVRRHLSSVSAEILAEDFDEYVTLRGTVPVATADALSRGLGDATRGRASIGFDSGPSRSAAAG